MPSGYDDPNAEVQRLQQELEKLRLKDLQQEHHIYALTQQLRSRSSVPNQGVAPAPGADSSVAAKWQEWHQKRSLSPEPFKRRSIAAGVYDKHVAQPATRGRQSPDRPHNTPAKSHHVAQPHFTHAAGSPDAHQQPAPHRPSSTQRSFGTQRRWYQPGQAADHAAALQRQALAAAAAEREVVDADWLLSTAPRGLSVSHQPSTFGSELRWWETKSGLGLDGPKADHRDASQHAQQSQKPCSRQTSPSQPRQRYPDGVCPLQVSHGLPEQVLPKKKCTFGSASRWFEYSDNNAVKHTSNASPAPASHHLASATYPSQRSVSRGNAAVPDHSKGISQSRTSAHAPPHSGNSRRPNSTDRGTVHPTSLPRFDRTSWSSDSTAASSAVLQRIQEKHAQIQQLAAMISQQQSAAGGGGRASKFGPDLQRGADSSGRATEATFQAPMPQKAAQVEGQGSNPSMQSTQSATAPAVDPAVHDPDSTVMPSQELPGKSGESLSQAAHGRPAELDPVRDMPVQQPRSSRLSNEQPASVSRLGRSTLDDHSASTSSFPYPPAPSLGAQSGASPIADDILPSLSSRGLMTNPSSTWLRGDWTSPVNPPGTHTLDRSGSASPSLRRTASIYDRSDLQEDIRNRSAERTRLDQMVAPHPSDWVQNLRDSCHWQRSNSIQKTRELQEDFVQKAESQLETFHQIRRTASETAPQSELNTSQKSGTGQGLPLKQIPQKAPAPTTRHLRQIVRTGSKSARQGSEASSVRRQGSSSKRLAAVHKQQQQAAQEAEQRLAAFQAAKEAQPHVSRPPQASRTPPSARYAGRAHSAVNNPLPQQGAAYKPRPGEPSAAQPRSVAGILSHDSLGLQQQRAARRASSGISWAAELQLQEPEDYNARDHMGSHMGAHMGSNTGDHMGSHSQPPPGHASLQDLAAQGLQPDQWRAREAAMDPSAAPVQAMDMQREGLNAYYRDKAVAEQAAYADARLYAQQIEQQNSQQQQQQQQMVSGNAVHAPEGLDLIGEAEAGTVVHGDSVLERLRGVKALASSLTLPSYRSVSLRQSEVDALSPGLPGLQSQLSKMMQEVSQARNEVQGLRSELDHSTLQNQKSGSFSLAGRDAEQ